MSDQANEIGGGIDGKPLFAKLDRHSKLLGRNDSLAQSVGPGPIDIVEKHRVNFSQRDRIKAPIISGPKSDVGGG